MHAASYGHTATAAELARLGANTHKTDKVGNRYWSFLASCMTGSETLCSMVEPPSNWRKWKPRRTSSGF
jgi:hypothetical protein